MKKRMLSMLLGAVMLLTMAVPALAEDTTFRQLYGAEVTTLNYLVTGTTNEFRLASNFIDTLVEYDRYGQVQPSLAESWAVSEDGLTWTFTLRDGLTWVDGNGEVAGDLTANDFVAAAKYILDAQNAASTANILYEVIEGAQAYFDGTATPEEGEEPAPVMEWDTVGVKALDDKTIEYTLITPVPYFLSMTTYVCFMPAYAPFIEEKGADFALATGNDTLLYCGAYYISDFQPQERRVMTKNPHNWDADNVFIEELVYTFNKESTTVAPEMYLRGELDIVEDLDSTIAMEWLADPEKADFIRPNRQTGFYSYFYAFNFDPQFDAVHEPDNWAIAVNNENFRKAIFHGLDRVKAMTIIEPEYPESNVYNTVTPPDFVTLGAVDYVDMGDLADITAAGTGTFDEAKATEYRDLARTELEEAGATFPVIVYMPYNPLVAGWDEECQVVEQQLEALLGDDFIDIVIEASNSQSFLSDVRRSGKYALLKCNWGPDYADPQTYTDPFSDGNSYNFMYIGMEGDFVPTYYDMVAAAMAITDDLQARYEAFAAAEAYLINSAVIVPFGFGSGGYTAGRFDPFERQYASFGISNYRFKGLHILEKPMNTDEYFEAYDQWLDERAALAE